MRASRGFTLIELMIVLAVLGLIAAIAVPAFTEQMRKSRRSDAIRCLGEVQLQQEKWRSNHTSYASIGAGGVTGCTSSDYTIAVTPSSATATTYTLTATPISGGAQAGDRCGTFTLAVNNANTPPVQKSAGAADCWNR